MMAATTAHASNPALMGSHLAYWEPEDRLFWAREGARVARRNLLLAVPPLVLSFAVWMMWSVVVVHLPRVGFHFTANQLFWLVALPGLAGGTLRLLFSFMVPLFGGRTWTTISTLALLAPSVGLGLAVQDPGTPYPTFLTLALLAGIGGGNFASSMANISFFYPAQGKGAALGWAAGLGNLGVGLAQVTIPAVIGFGLFGTLGGVPQNESALDGAALVWLQNAGFAWVPLILVAATAAWVGMDDLVEFRASMADQAVVFLRADTWLLAWLYLGTFGSFIGFAAGFPLLAATDFPGTHTAELAFVGPLLAAIARPIGGWMADRHGAAHVTFATFVAMACAIATLLVLGITDESPVAYPLFIALFMVVFIASGVGNGALFALIPAVFAARGRADDGVAPDAVSRDAALEGAAALGLASGIAAFGGFFIPKAYGTALLHTGSTFAALVPFLVFYVSCIALTWWRYARAETSPRRRAARASPSHARERGRFDPRSSS